VDNEKHIWFIRKVVGSRIDPLPSESKFGSIGARDEFSMKGEWNLH